MADLVPVQDTKVEISLMESIRMDSTLRQAQAGLYGSNHDDEYPSHEEYSLSRRQKRV